MTAIEPNRPYVGATSDGFPAVKYPMHYVPEFLMGALSLVGLYLCFA